MGLALYPHLACTPQLTPVTSPEKGIFLTRIRLVVVKAPSLVEEKSSESA